MFILGHEVCFYYRGYLGPGGLAHDQGDVNVSLCTGGAASYIDRKIFGEGRIYQTPTCKVNHLLNICNFSRQNTFELNHSVQGQECTVKIYTCSMCMFC